jgi:DNA-directed RNA polymerase subunit H (RpoH/RPB5)
MDKELEIEQEIQAKMWNYVEKSNGLNCLDFEEMQEIVKNEIQIAEILQFYTIGKEGLPLIKVKDANGTEYGILFGGQYKSIKLWKDVIPKNKLIKLADIKKIK